MCNLKGLKENSRGTGIKTIMCSIAVMCVLLGSSAIAQGIEWQWPWLKAKEQKTKQEQVVKKKNLPLRAKQIGTPTVQQLLDKVESNYHKIQDLKANWNFKTWDSEFAKWLGIVGDLITQDEEFFFKAPDKLKWIPPNELFTLVKKNNIEYRRMGDGWAVEATQDTPVRPTNLPWYTLLDPDRFDFYWRLDEIITKFDTQVIDNPEPDIWVIEAVPKASNPKINPENNYNYPTPGWLKYEFTVDFNKGVFTKITDIGIKSGNISSTAELSNFELINNTWIPTKLVKTVEETEEITLSNIQLNTGIPDSEFEFK